MGGGKTRMIRYVYNNIPWIIFKIAFLNDNGKQYNEILNVNGNDLNAQMHLSIVKVSNVKYTTKHDDGYCPLQWIYLF